MLRGGVRGRGLDDPETAREGAATIHRERVQQAVAILLDNAAKYTGGWAR
jgi:hypothetical protein